MSTDDNAELAKEKEYAESKKRKENPTDQAIPPPTPNPTAQSNAAENVSLAAIAAQLKEMQDSQKKNLEERQRLDTFDAFVQRAKLGRSANNAEFLKVRKEFTDGKIKDETDLEAKLQGYTFLIYILNNSKSF